MVNGSNKFDLNKNEKIEDYLEQGNNFEINELDFIKEIKQININKKNFLIEENVYGIWKFKMKV